MTQALNLGLLGNNVNTSGQVSLTAGVSGTLPVANGGIGTTTLTANNVLLGNGGSAPQVVAPGSSGNVLTSNGSTWTSAALPVAVPSGVDAIGTVVVVANLTTSNLVGGNTVAGSSLSYVSAVTNTSGNRIYTNGNASTNPYTFIQAPATYYPMGSSYRWSLGNTGFNNPGGFTTLSGTWRLLHVAYTRTSYYESAYDFTVAECALTLAVRIA